MIIDSCVFNIHYEQLKSAFEYFVLPETLENYVYDLR